MKPIRLLLFDLDGTLVDTAPDMAGACNDLRAEEGLEPVDPATLRDYVSKGARGVLGAGFPEPIDPAERRRRERRFLELYAARVARLSRPFAGTEEVLERFSSGGRRWGVVTNKPEWLARPLLEQLGLLARAAALVGGDTLPHRKPDPRPLLHAARECNVAVEDCVYVGDDERDMAAGRAAGMRTAVALWGYILPGEDPRRWGADWVCENPGQLLEILEAPA